MATLVNALFSRVTDANGTPISGAKLYWYLAGTTTPATVYSDSSTTTPLPFPILSNSSGIWADGGGNAASIFVKDGSYKIVVTDASGTLLDTKDNFTLVTPSGGSSTVSSPVTLKTANYAVQASDRNGVIIVDASAAPGQNIVITADSATLTNGFPFSVVNVGSVGTVTVAGTGAQTINQASSFTLSTQNQSARFASNGASGWVIDASTAGSFISAATFFAISTFNGKAQFNAQTAFKEQTITWVSSPSVTTFDPALGPDLVISLAGAAMTMGPMANIASNVGCRGALRFVQDGTGGRTITWDATWTMADGTSPVIGNQAFEETVFTYWVKSSTSVILSPRPAFRTVQRFGTSLNGSALKDFSIPSWAKRVTVTMAAMSTNGTSPHVLKLAGGGGVFPGAGYVGANMISGGGGNATATHPATAFYANHNTMAASASVFGRAIFDYMGSNSWEVSINSIDIGSSTAANGAGYVTLSGAIDTVRWTTVGGTDTIDAGALTVTIEG